MGQTFEPKFAKKFTQGNSAEVVLENFLIVHFK